MRLANYDELATFLRMPKGTLRSMVSKGKIPHSRVSERVVLFDLDVIEKWITERMTGGAK